jgi:hypothetical protein
VVKAREDTHHIGPSVVASEDIEGLVQVGGSGLSVTRGEQAALVAVSVMAAVLLTAANATEPAAVRSDRDLRTDLQRNPR